MPERTDFEDLARKLLRAEMARHGITYAQLVDKLKAVGVDDNERNVRNKVSRGKFTAAFMLACLKAIGVNEIRLN